ncbi:MAG: hypothetical protein Q8S02_02835 [Hydrogenophaga sp.]|nr:hypothetical protein [Hydrogenophaga sp.]
MASHPPLQMVQTSAWNGFRYDFLDASGTVIGHFEFPNFAQARNARLRWHRPGSTAGDIQMQLDGAHRVDFEYLSRGWTNDLRYRLLRGDAVLAHMDVCQVRGRRWPDITLHGPVTAQLHRTGRWWRSALVWRDTASGQPVAQMQAPATFTLKYRCDITGERLPTAIKGFLGVVVASLRLL